MHRDAGICFPRARQRQTRSAWRMAPSTPKENVMRRQVILVLASAALAGSLLATDAQARGGGGYRGGGVAGHMGGRGGAHFGPRAGGFGGARVEGIGGRYITGISRGAVGYAGGAGYGAGIAYGTGIRYGTGILRNRYSGFAAAAFAQ